jgi:hypothetical protein
MSDAHWTPSPTLRSTTWTPGSSAVASMMAWLAVKWANLTNGDTSCSIRYAGIRFSGAGAAAGWRSVRAPEIIRDRRPLAK